MDLIVKEYLGSNIEFKMINGSVYAKANTMTDSKRLENWKASQNTKRYIEALENNNSLKSSEFIMS